MCLQFELSGFLVGDSTTVEFDLNPTVEFDLSPTVEFDLNPTVEFDLSPSSTVLFYF